MQTSSIEQGEEKMKATVIFVKTTFNAEHCWKNAPKEVSFLRKMHPHTFFVEVEIEVTDQNRELEFFIVKRKLDKFINNNLANTRSSRSCEQMAQLILDYLEIKYGEDRMYSVQVSEDNVNGAYVCQGV